MSVPTHTTTTTPIIGNFRILQGFLNRIALLLVRRLGTGRVEGGPPLMFLYILTKNRSWLCLAGCMSVCTLLCHTSSNRIGTLYGGGMTLSFKTYTETAPMWVLPELVKLLNP